jgi:hypothetical protein
MPRQAHRFGCSLIRAGYPRRGAARKGEGGLVGGECRGRGRYENVSEYVRDLIRRDTARSQGEAFERLKAELTHAFAAPDAAYRPLSADDIIKSRPHPSR